MFGSKGFRLFAINAVILDHVLLNILSLVEPRNETLSFGPALTLWNLSDDSKEHDCPNHD
jgi:hypothetical protein